MNKDELIEWLNTLSSDSTIVIGSGGLELVEVNKNNEPTGAYLEIGSVD